MLDPTSILIGTAYAQSAPTASPGGSSTGAAMMNFVPLILIFAVFYFLLIRPQQKKLDEHQKMVKALQRGDRIVTNGGIHGKIVRLEGDDILIVEIADGVQVKLNRSAVSALAAKTEPVAPAGDAGKAD